MVLTDFIQKYSGKPGVGTTPENTGQCVGLVEKYLQEYGLPAIWGNAKDLMANADRTAYRVIANTPAGVPVVGDIFCFNGTYGGGFGHTGIVVNANTASVTLFEQNDPYQSPPHLKAYNYNAAMGWLHTDKWNQNKVLPVTHVVNVRTGPHVTAAVVGQLVPGIVETTGQVTGDWGTVAGKTSNLWDITLNGHYFCHAATL